ncbi:MAG: hypothetical protein GXY58_14345, partial [Planctomycetaceae bacterium]|nr:hypothetical protein [Planctomycetaceae bacterium]
MAYIDDIKIQRTKTYGVAVSAKNWAPDAYPGITRYGEATNATIKNGAILQGRDNATRAHAIYGRSTSNITVDNTSITVAGANSSALQGQDTTSWVITDNDLTSNVRTITSRDNFYGTVICNVGGTISRNTIHNGPHAGIYASQGNSTIDNNVIQLKTKYTNAFAIVMRNASEAHHNTINCGVGEFAARGIQISGNTTGNTAKIHHNTITVQGTTDNQEYGGAQVGGFYGIQIENCSDVEVYENTVTAIASVTDAAAFRMNVDGADPGSNVYVHDNTFIGQRTGTGVGAAPLMFTNVSGHEVTFERNTLESNSLFVRRSRACSDIVLLSSTLKATGDLATLIPIESYNWDFQQLHAIENLKWVDNAYYDATSQTLLKNASVLNSNGAVDPYSSFIHSFTTTFQVTNAQGAAVANAAVTVVDKDNREVFAGTTDANGQVAAVLDEFRTQGDVKTTYGPYRVTAGGDGSQAEQQFDADHTQTIRLQLGAGSGANDAPVLTLPGTQSATEDTAKQISGIRIADADAGSGQLLVTMTVAHGRLTLPQRTGLAFTVGDGVSDQALTFTGTLADLNAALASVQYLGHTNYSGADTLRITVDDQGNSGTGGPLSDTGTVPITVAPVNDPPVLTVPGAQTVNEDSSLSIRRVNVADPDATTNPVRMTISAEHGTLSLARTFGLNFLVGDGTNDTTMTFTSSQVYINAALVQIIYRPAPNYSGSDAVSISVDDQGNIGAGGSQVSTTSIPVTVKPVNDAPALITNQLLAVPAAGQALISPSVLQVTDIDSPSHQLVFTLVSPPTSGALRLAGSDLGAGSVFTQADIDEGLVSYAHDGSAATSDSFLFSVTDSAGGTIGETTFNIRIYDAINTPPVLTLPGAQSATEDTVKQISGIRIADADAGSGQLLVTMSVARGWLTLRQRTGLTFTVGDGVSDQSLTFTGTLADLNAALARVDYLGHTNYAGADTLRITVDDQGNTGTGGPLTDTGTVPITVAPVNDPPVLTVPGAQTVNEDSSLRIRRINVADPDATTNPVKMTISAEHGTLSLARTFGLNFLMGDGTKDTTMTFTSSQAYINAALVYITYRPDPNYNGPDVITISVDDQGNIGAGGAQVSTTSIPVTVKPVNDAPTLTVNQPLAVPTARQALISPAVLQVTDIDSPSHKLVFTLVSPPTYGALRLAGSDLRAGSVFTQADIDAGRVSYAHDGSAATSDSFLFSVTDSAGGTIGETTFNIRIYEALNASPVLTLPGAQSATEDAVKQISGIRIADADAGSGQLLVTMSVARGQLTLPQRTGLAFTVGDGVSDQTLTFTGTLDDLNAVLASVQYLGHTNYAGADTLRITVDDQGNTGTGGPLSDTGTVPITVAPVNDPPVLTVPGAQTVNEDTSLSIRRVNVADPDATTNPVMMAIYVEHGTVSLARTFGLNFLVGDGTNDTAMAFTSSQVYINAALVQIIYRPDPNYNGPDAVSIGVHDQGNIGAGGAQVSTTSIPVTVKPVNDAPALTVNQLLAVPAARQALISPSVLQVTDIDSPSHKLVFTLVSPPAYGALRLAGADLRAGSIFTQADIDAGLVSYAHDGSATTSDSFLFSVSDSAGGTIGETTFNIQVTPRWLNVETNGQLQSGAVESYTSQDERTVLMAVEDDGNTLHMVGNTWKSVFLTIGVTPYTVLEFDFESSRQGEVHAIGFDTDDAFTLTDRFFQLYGTETLGYQQFRIYDPLEGSHHFQIPVGKYLTGSFDRLVFVGDDDAQALADHRFSNIRLTNLNRAPTITSTPVTSATPATPYSYDVAATDPDVGDTLTYSLVTAPSGMTINSSTGLLQWTPTTLGMNAVTVRVQD